MKNLNRISKKKRTAGQICSGQAASRWAGPDPAKGRRGAVVFEPASGPVWSAAPGDRNGTEQARPSDQVAIDDRRSSSTREKSGAVETLGFCRGTEGLTMGIAHRQRGVAAAVGASRGRVSLSVKQKGLRAKAWSRGCPAGAPAMPQLCRRPPLALEGGNDGVR
jgi:hypothetical protein